MSKWDWLPVGLFALALAIIVTAAFSPTWETFWLALFGQTAAAWVQAVGVFVAVWLTGRMTREHADQLERARVERQLGSTKAVVAKALQSLNDLNSGVLLKIHGEDVQVARDPPQTLLAAYEALTPMRIHELPDYVLVTLAMDIKAGLAVLYDHLEGEKFDSLRLSLPQHVQTKIKRSLTDCEDFIKYADSGKWRS